MGVFRKDTPAQQAQPLPYATPRALTAAASRVNIKDKGEADAFRKRRSSQVAMWQSEAWEYYDAIPEVKYAFNLASQIVSRIRLFAAVTEDVSQAPVAVRTSSTVDPKLADAAERALARLDSAYGGQAGLMRDAALNLNVAGECYIVQIPERMVNGQYVPESWDIRSVDELIVGGDTWPSGAPKYKIITRRDLIGQATRPNAMAVNGIIDLPEEAYVGRLWRAHPRFSEEPDSSLRGILDLCAELLLLNRTFRATERSRLNAGALYLPDGLSLANSPDPDAGFDDEYNPDMPTLEEQEDDFEEQLLQAMTTPIRDEDSASAVVPLIIRGPEELGEKIKQFKFERSFDASLIARGDKVLDRILNGLDVPKDLITGMANVKYSNAQQIDDALYKSHIEPMVLLISDAITQVYLRPYLKSIGYDEASVNRIVVWYDPSSISTRTDRASDADSGFEKNAISADAWRRAHGFSDADAPNSTEYLLKMLTGHAALSPELTEAILTAVAPDVMSAAKAASQASSVAPLPGDVTNALNGGQGTVPQTDPTSQSIDEAAGLASTDAPEAAGENSVVPPDSDEVVDAGEDAPPFKG